VYEPSQAIQIHQATPADAVELARLRSIFDDVLTSPAFVARRLATCHEFERAYLAAVEGRVVGFAALRLVPALFDDAPYAELTELFVEEAQRRHGVGQALVRHVEDAARAAGAGQLFLLTGFHNTTAHHFYHRSGYSLRCLTLYKTL
jgi:GNAT superfamily N-acetyltransferase